MVLIRLDCICVRDIVFACYPIHDLDHVLIPVPLFLFYGLLITSFQSSLALGLSTSISSQDTHFPTSYHARPLVSYIRPLDSHNPSSKHNHMRSSSQHPLIHNQHLEPVTTPQRALAACMLECPPQPLLRSSRVISLDNLLHWLLDLPRHRHGSRT
jgi:hypothetical protein